MRIKELTTEDVKNIMMDKALIIVLVFMIIGIIIVEPSSLQIRVLTDVLTQSTVKVICALSLMFALLLGGTNLSGSHQIDLAAVVVTSLSQIADYSNKFWPGLPEPPIIVPVIVTLALVTVIGAANNFMIAKLKMAPFIAASGMNTIVYGVNYLCFAKKPNNSRPIRGIGDALTVLSNFRIFSQISLLVVIAIIIIAGVWFLLNKTVFGKNIYIVGGNPEATRVSGINVDRVIIAVFIIGSMFVGPAGILEVARTGGASSAYGNAYEFDAISSCMMGSVSLNGGVEKVSGVVIGALVSTFISYGLAYIDVNSNWQLIVKGLIICGAAALDMRKNS